MAEICPVDAGTPGAIKTLNPQLVEYFGEYSVPAKHVPFSCKQVCTDAEYNSALLNVIMFNFIAPILLAYAVSSLLVFGFNRFRK